MVILELNYIQLCLLFMSGDSDKLDKCFRHMIAQLKVVKNFFFKFSAVSFGETVLSPNTQRKTIGKIKSFLVDQQSSTQTPKIIK